MNPNRIFLDFQIPSNQPKKYLKTKKQQPNTTNTPIIKPPKQHPLSLSSTTKPSMTCHQ